MKKVYTLILIVVLVAPFILKNAVLVSFYIHQNYIAAELCVEKDVEGSCCQGSCVLQKELRKAETSSDHLPQQLTEKTEIVFVFSLKENNAIALLKDRLTHATIYRALYSEEHATQIAHPPSFIG